MGYPIRDRDSGGGRNFDRRGGGGDRGVRRAEMHKATCSSCGKECEVPFRPTGERPVYCRDCFAKNGGGERRESFGRDSRDSRPPFRPFNTDARGPRPEPHAHTAPPAPHAHHNEQFAAINSKLDKLITLLTANAPKPKEEKVKKEATTPVVVAPIEKKEAATKKKKATKKVAKTPTE